MTPNIVDIWDRLIVAPMIVGVFLFLACLIQVVASPRVVARLWLRATIAALLFFYIVLMLIEAPRAGEGVWYVDALTFVRWSFQIFPPALCFWLMRKVERILVDRPLKTRFFGTRDGPSAG